MKQRIKLAQALVHDPDLLFLDEPTNGMDPKGRDEMLELIRDIAHNKGLNLILSSHLLPDVEYTCDHVVVLDKGAVATEGPIAALKGHGGRVFELRVKGDADGVRRGAPRRRPRVPRHRRGRDARVRARTSAARAVAVPAGGAAQACRCGICAPACRRSKTCSRSAVGMRRWSVRCPIHDQGYRRYAGRREPHGRAGG